MRIVEQILELARWAPSGDNTQPWRFEVLSDDHFVVHGFDTRDWCIYDIDGRPSQLALGALLRLSCFTTRNSGSQRPKLTLSIVTSLRGTVVLVKARFRMLRSGSTP